jgi:WhiB family redox-sensing transcriptional regulator
MAREEVLVRTEGESPETFDGFTMPEPWVQDALCAQTDPEAFFPDKGGSTHDAKAVCASCDVVAECLAYALRNDERFGIWGGLSERERRKLNQKPKGRKKACVHGHAYTPENTRFTPKGAIRCRACDRNAQAMRRRNA